MIKFIDTSEQPPFIIFKNLYKEAFLKSQANIEAMAISSYNQINDEVNSRFVNLKFVHNDKFIFFSNYNSPKSIEFDLNKKVSALFFWSKTNTQIRIKSKISKSSQKYNKTYFKSRSIEKNALAISSNQSTVISSYDEVIKKYNLVKNNSNLLECPDYWGGFFLIPYEFEFWKGNKNRLNKRDLYKRNSGKWERFILEP